MNAKDAMKIAAAHENAVETQEPGGWDLFDVSKAQGYLAALNGEEVQGLVEAMDAFVNHTLGYNLDGTFRSLSKTIDEDTERNWIKVVHLAKSKREEFRQLSGESKS